MSSSTEPKQDDALSKYAIGHTPGAVNAHSGRSAAKHAAFLLPHLRPGMQILDVGCGPGSITSDLAQLVPDGHTTGVDLSPAVIERARAAAAGRNISNITFESANVLNGLPFKDESFDLVFCHQLLNHLSDPVKAIREMKRLCKLSGTVALREGIMHIWHPDDPLLLEMDQILATTMRAGGAATPGAGRCIHMWAKEAGFDPDLINYRVSGVPAMGAKARGNMRAFFEDSFSQGSPVRKKAVQAGVDEKRIDVFLEAALQWTENEEAYQVMVCGEAICKMEGETQ